MIVKSQKFRKKRNGLVFIVSDVIGDKILFNEEHYFNTRRMDKNVFLEMFEPIPEFNEEGITDALQDDINDVSIRITNKLIKLGYVPDCGDSDDESEFEVQDTIREYLQEMLKPTILNK